MPDVSVDAPAKTPAEDKPAPQPSGRSKDEIALELMKFIAVTTGYGRGTPSAGFSGKPTARSPEEYADKLLELFERCRTVVNTNGGTTT